MLMGSTMAKPAGVTTITMTMHEIDRLKTIQAVVDRMLRVGQAAQRPGVSRRQVNASNPRRQLAIRAARQRIPR
jgi:hypothetical protein